MKTGSDKEELFRYLKEIDENTSCDSILTSGNKLTLTLIRGKRGIKWSAIESQDGRIFSGKSMEEFKKIIRKEGDETVLKYVDVACMYESKPTKTWDGKFRCSFFILDPLEPYAIENGKVIIPTKDIELTKDEYEACLDTRILFIDGDILYPFKTESFPGISSYLDAGGVLKKIDTVPLSQAMIVAERIASKSKLAIITNKVSERMREVVGVAGKTQAERESRVAFFDKVFSYMSGKGMYVMVNYKIAKEKTVVKVKPLINTQYIPIIEITYPSITGIPISVKSLAQFGPGHVELLRNVHKQMKGSISVPSLFENIYESFDSFEKIMSKKISYYIQPTELKGLRKALGKKRVRKKKYFAHSHIGNAYGHEIAKEIVSNTFERVPKIQAEQLSKEYYNVLCKIVSEESC